MISNNIACNKIDDETNKGFFQRSQTEIWSMGKYIIYNIDNGINISSYPAKRRGSFEYAKKKSKVFRLSWSDINEGKLHSNLNRSRDLSRKVSFDSVTLFYEACRDGDCHVLQRLIDEVL